MRLSNWRHKFGGTREIAAVLLLVALIAANVFFSLPAKPALSESKPQPGPREVKPDEYTKVFGQGKNEFHSETIDDGQFIKPLPLDLVEEKSTLPERGKGEVPDSVKSDNPTDPKPDFLPMQTGSETTTLLNGTDIEIATLVKAFSKLTKRNYIVDNNVKGKVTVHLTTPVSVDEAIRIFESILLLKGFTTVPVGANIWKVINTKDAQKSTIPIVSGEKANPSDVLVTQLIRLKYTLASELQSVLNQFVSKDGLLSAFAGTNSLIVIDSEANIKRIIELVDQLDVPAIDQDITIIPILHADAKDVADKIQQILGEDKDKEVNPRAQLGVQPRPISFTPPTGGNQANSANASGVVVGERRALPLKIIADERTNSVIVVADSLLTAKVKALAEQLDSKTDQSGGKFYVYRLKHADAEELSDILNSLVSGGSSGSSSSSSNKKSKTSGSSLSRGNSRSGRRDSFGNNNRLSGSLGGTAALTSSGSDSSSSGKVAFEGDISISADSSTNSLVINASKTDYEKLRQVIDELDIRRQQVLVEATIMQVSLDRNQGVGVEWTTALGTDDFGAIGQNNFGGLTNLIANPAALSDLTLAAASSGSIVLPGGITLPSQAVLISALSRNTNVNVLSSPTILATDNEEAEIVVGQNVPFITSTSTNATNLNNTFNSIERQDVGITLRITPQISAGGFVVLKIFVEVSSVVSGTQNDPNGPTTSVNTTETTVEVKSNQMIVTGGLISDEVSDATRGVPFLEDIPLLGHLFKRSDSTRRRNNLLLFITPKVVSDQFVAREQTKARSGRMKDEIRKLEAEPDRSEVLDSENQDEVVEEFPERDVTPGTITRPKGARNLSPDEKAAEDRTIARLRSLSGQNIESKEADESDELTFSVKPRLPGDTRSSSNAKTEVSRSSLRSGESSPRSDSSAKTYVVLRQVGGNPSVDLPFHYADGERTVGVVVLGSQSSAPGKFFTIGKRYLFRQGEEDIPFVCLGSFASRDDAKVLQSALSADDLWYSLSPAESLALGRNAWRAF